MSQFCHVSNANLLGHNFKSIQAIFMEFRINILWVTLYQMQFILGRNHYRIFLAIDQSVGFRHVSSADHALRVKLNQNGTK